MHEFARKMKASQGKESVNSLNHITYPALRLHRAIDQRFAQTASPLQEQSSAVRPLWNLAIHQGHDFSRIPVHSQESLERMKSQSSIHQLGNRYSQETGEVFTAGCAFSNNHLCSESKSRGFAPGPFESKSAGEKNVDEEDSRTSPVEANVLNKGSEESKDMESLTGKKKAGVESFVVDWSVSPHSGPTIAKFRIGFNAVFMKDSLHDPALADFRQNVEQKGEITAGPNKGKGPPPKPMHDDGYSRADDQKHTKDDIHFASNDHPGPMPVHEDDVLNFSFTAEQMIIDTSLGNKLIAKRGPYTATIKGKHPRTYGGVPKILE
jgi:hypothetical protein